MINTPSVLVTFDSMKNDNCGYFYFGKGLGNALIANNQKFNLSFYLHKRTSYKFEHKVRVYILSKFHKWFFPYKNKFDVVHFSDQTCRLKPTKVNAAKIMTVHDMNKVHLKFSKPHRIQIYLNELRKLIASVDKVVAISEFVANDLKHYFPEAKSKIAVIYNGADKLSVPDDYQPVNVKPAKPFLFTIGLLSVQKGFHLLPALLQNNNYELVIAGIETPHKQTIINEAIKYNCLDRVHITGPVSDLDKSWYFKNCVAFAFPSRTEGFGLPVIEAMHFGKPVFLARKTSLPEVGGDVAYYFENFEPEHMQEVFKSGMDDYNRNIPVEEIIKQAEKFSWDNAAKQYLTLYEECLLLNKQ